jgi:hypothetical protein
MKTFPERFGGENQNVVGGKSRVIEVVARNDAFSGLGVASFAVGGVLH